jgi:hypothetical protein
MAQNDNNHFSIHLLLSRGELSGYMSKWNCSKWCPKLKIFCLFETLQTREGSFSLQTKLQSLHSKSCKRKCGKKQWKFSSLLILRLYQKNVSTMAGIEENNNLKKSLILTNTHLQNCCFNWSNVLKFQRFFILKTVLYFSSVQFISFQFLFFFFFLSFQLHRNKLDATNGSPSRR